VFVYGIVSVGVSDATSFVYLVILWALSSLYYFLVANDQQSFSVEEQQTIFWGGNAVRTSRFTIAKTRCSRKLIYHIRPEKISTKPVLAKNLQKIGVCPNNVSNRRLKATVKHDLKSVHEMLLDPTESEKLRETALAAFCVESVDFCLAVVSYRNQCDEILKRGVLYDSLEILHNTFQNISNTYIADNASDEVNVSSAHKANILKFRDFQAFRLLHPLKMATVFDESYVEIEKVLTHNLIMK